MIHRYAIALGANRPRSRACGPRETIRRAMVALDAGPCRLVARSPLFETPPVGPALRRFVNAAALIETDLLPPELLRHLHGVERAFGRRRARRWGERTLDLDIILWSGGRWRERALAIPHPAYAARDFVLRPLVHVAARWRDPARPVHMRALRHRILRAKPVDPAPAAH